MERDTWATVIAEAIIVNQGGDVEKRHGGGNEKRDTGTREVVGYQCVTVYQTCSFATFFAYKIIWNDIEGNQIQYNHRKKYEMSLNYIENIIESYNDIQLFEIS